MVLSGKKKVNGYDLESVVFQCNCGSLTHQLQFSMWEDESFMTAIVYKDLSFWFRLKAAFQYLFRRKQLYLFDLVLDKKDVKELVKTLNKLV